MSLATNTKLTDNTQWGVFLLSLLCFAFGLLVAMSDAIAESSGCARKAAAEYPWICTDTDAVKAFTTVDAALAETLGKIEPRDREIFQLQQVSWEQRLSAICEGPLLGAQTRIQCISSFTEGRLEEIARWPRRGKSIVVEPSPVNNRACDAALQRDQIAWQWMSRYKDNYKAVSQVLADEPAWMEIAHTGAISIRKATFNFIGGGEPEEVFSLSVSVPGTPYDRYIVATSAEAAMIEQQLGTIRRIDDDALYQLATSLRYPVGAWASYTANQSVFERKNKKAPTLESSLYDTSNSEVYQSWYTRSRVAIFEDQVFLIASSVNNHEPSVALFRPAEGGRLELVCFHNAIPSAERPTIQVLTDQYACPAGLQQKPIAWNVDSNGAQQAAVDLSEWGGQRWVVQRSWASHQYSSQWIDVSAVGATLPPDENSWEPISGITSEDGDTIQLILTEAGPYITSTSWIPAGDEDDRPVKTTYYRIHDNRLKAVCERTMTLVTPPGYAIEGGAK